MIDAYNDEKRWTESGIFKRPDFDVRGYQKALDRIVGVSISNQPIVRLIWAWDARKWQNFKWDEFGNATEGEWRQKYKALTIQIDEDDYVDISPPRWVLEERFEPEQYANSWESSRYVHDPSECRRCANISMGLIEQSTTCVRRDVWGAAPRDGWYNALPNIGIIAEHDDGGECCDRLWKESRELCYGRYKVPDDRELSLLRRAIARRNQDNEVNPHAELSEADLAEARAWGLQAAKDEEVRKRNELKELYKDEVLVHGASVIPDVALLALKEAGRRVPINRTRFT